MGKVLPFKKPKAASRHRGNTLCKRGFHKWEVVNRPFDVKKGELLACYRCVRCGLEKNESR